jgi:hypothetical protein
MNLEIQGKIIKVMEKQTGEGRNGAWQKQEFVIETVGEQYPKKVCCNVWGDKVDTLSRFNINDEVKLGINIESREYNERWYTDVKVWKIDLVVASTAGAQAPVGSATVQQPNFQTTEAAAPASAGNTSNFLEAEENDDLPF